jgi:HAD superfamily hydrolase (TIGR01509 family)
MFSRKSYAMSSNTVFVFDFDGVIVDSINALYGVYMDFLSEFGVRGKQEEFNFLNGPKLSEIVVFLKEKYAINKSEDELLNIYLNKITSIYESIKLNNGVEETLKLLNSKNIKIALASSSKKEDIKSVLNKNKLNNYFDFVITGDDVEKAKPSSEIYDAVKIKYPKHDYFVIEDSENGVKAAIGAGMHTILYNPTQKKVSVKPNQEIHSLNQIKNILKEIDLNCFTVSRAKEITLKTVEYELFISESQAIAIDKLWNDELKKRKLFNGKIVSYKSHDKSGDTLRIECFVTQYKYFFAQLREPGLNLNITPIGVSGIIIDTDNNTIVAARHNVTEYEGFYEFMPAGSIDSSKTENGAILFQEQIIEEYEEETQFKKLTIDKIKPYCLIFDKNHGVYDICSKIHIKGLINNLMKSNQTEEYKNIEIMNIEEIKNSITANKFVPTSVVIYNNLD